MTLRAKPLTCLQVQKQLLKQGIRDFTVTQVTVPESDIREFLAARLASLAQERPDAVILRAVRPALARLAKIAETTPVFRWEAESELGKIVGYSCRQTMITVYPWVMQGRDWVASMLIT